MKLYYYYSSKGNFGDDLNSWLWDALIPDFFDNDESVRLSGIGTIITSNMPVAKQWIIFSSGVGYDYPPIGFGSDSWDTICVRGPLSARVLGLNQDKYITDGAALLQTLSEFTPLTEKERSGIIFIPHHHALITGKWEEVCKRAGIEFVSPEWDSKLVIHKIRSAKLVLADAMHAAIIADAMRVPWVPLITSNQINTFKWLDWTQTIKLPYLPTVLGSSSLRESIRDKGLRLYGEKYYQSDADVETAIKCFLAQRDLKNKRWWKHYHNATRLLIYRIPNKTVELVENNFKFNLNDKFMEHAVDVLSKASAQQGFLSSECVFNENLSRLVEGLDKIQKYR
ncbi:TPA: hypothetical protein MBS28_005132 [Klebsiella aerogenes]|jgi:succinoglycan biosynthesis protein ExoV|uniref:Exopolysaccharide glucosyl ketal-pyruvate-transferase n=1 Tax=Klebsiella aerogenes TaxID=548 RepID=A0A346NTH1_KLEAE|nr:polysaccharide pyruvyl transferase family protein [Klebsiella aerogenes]AWD03955.1 exosortase [Klebsiella aerogenes]AXR70564.1 exopolysaccharide glucosyl ketal-pyruvate-transferase [Klebsiella aerogenes]EJC6252491.1 hypothetical protein [Klebsiella aerogenes]ELA2477573.1 hypothetical protein [Klebsiella aerogenes]KJM44262.1 exosortase [Klebsiella aerogenes]